MARATRSACRCSPSILPSVSLSAGFRSWSSVLQISTVGVQLELQLEFQLEFHKAHKNCSLVVSSRKKKENTYLLFFLFWKTPTVGLILIPSELFPSKVRTPTGNSNWTPTGLQLSSELDQFVIDLDAPGARSGSLSSRRISDGRQESSGGTNPYASAALRRRDCLIRRSGSKCLRLLSIWMLQEPDLAL